MKKVFILSLIILSMNVFSETLNEKPFVFNNLSFAQQVSSVTKGITSLYNPVSSYKNLNSKLIYNARLIDKENTGWDMGALESNQSFFVSFLHIDNQTCENAIVQVKQLSEVKSAKCIKNKSMMVINPDKG